MMKVYIYRSREEGGKCSIDCFCLTFAISRRSLHCNLIFYYCLRETEWKTATIVYFLKLNHITNIVAIFLSCKWKPFYTIAKFGLMEITFAWIRYNWKWLGEKLWNSLMKINLTFSDGVATSCWYAKAFWSALIIETLFWIAITKKILSWTETPLYASIADGGICIWFLAFINFHLTLCH